MTGYEGNTWFIGPSDRNVAQSQNHVPKIPVNNCQFCYTLYYRCKYSFKQLFMLHSSASSALFRWRRTHMVWQLRSWTSRTIHIKFFRPRLNFNLFNWLFVRKTLYRNRSFIHNYFIYFANLPMPNRFRATNFFNSEPYVDNIKCNKITFILILVFLSRIRLQVGLQYHYSILRENNGILLFCQVVW